MSDKMNDAKNPVTENPEEVVRKLLIDVETKADEIIEAAKKQAAEIIASAEKQPSVSKPVEAGPTKTELKDAHEKVEIELFKDNNLYRDDVYVAVNGQNIKIKRGRKVRVDKMFAEVLDNSRRQDAVAADLNEQLENEYREKSDALE